MVDTTSRAHHDPNHGPHDRASEFSRLAGEVTTRTDVLSQMLALMRLRGETVYVIATDRPTTHSYAPGHAHFYFVERGSFWIGSDGDAPMCLFEGDLLLLPHGLGHTVSNTRAGLNAPSQYLHPWNPLQQPASEPDIGLERAESSIRVVGGMFHFEAAPMPAILSSLPYRLYLPRGDRPNPSWLTGLAHFLVEEMDASMPGSTLMVSRLIDLLVIRALRTWIASRLNNNGWLGGLKDDRIARSLGAIHAHPARNWSVHALAEIANMSRSIFAEKFVQTVGLPPMRYLTRWKLSLAADLLKSDGLKVTQVALRVGYESDAAFSRAFKAQHGYPPSEARLGRR